VDTTRLLGQVSLAASGWPVLGSPVYGFLTQINIGRRTISDSGSPSEIEMDLSQRLRVVAGCSFPDDDNLLKDQLSRGRYQGPKVLAEHPFNDVCGYVQSPRLCQDLFEPSCFLAIGRFEERCGRR
jgi:hypothetical protein